MKSAKIQNEWATGSLASRASTPTWAPLRLRSFTKFDFLVWCKQRSFSRNLSEFRTMMWKFDEIFKPAAANFCLNAKIRMPKKTTQATWKTPRAGAFDSGCTKTPASLECRRDFTASQRRRYLHILVQGMRVGIQLPSTRLAFKVEAWCTLFVPCSTLGIANKLEKSK